MCKFVFYCFLVVSNNYCVVSLHSLLIPKYFPLEPIFSLVVFIIYLKYKGQAHLGLLLYVICLLFLFIQNIYFCLYLILR